MITPITATFPALNFPKEADYPTQEDWAAFSAAAEANYAILSGEWSDKSEDFKAQTNNLAQEIQDIGENAINAITLDNITQLKLNSNMGRVDVLGYYAKGDGGGGTFYWDSTSTETDNGGTIIQATGIAIGRWKRALMGTVNVKWFGNILDENTYYRAATSHNLPVEVPAGTYNILTNLLNLTPYTFFSIGTVTINNHSTLKVSGVTIQGNVFNGSSQLVKLNSDGKIPPLDGSNITNLPVSSVISSTIYATVALGLTATTEGNLFSVVGDNTNTYILIYKKVSGAAVFQSSAPSFSYVDSSTKSTVITNRTTFAKSFTNLVNPLGDGYGQSGYFQGTGLIANASYTTVNKIPCKPGDNLLFKSKSPAYIAYFDSTGVQRGTLDGTSSIVPATIGGYVPAYYSFSCTNANLAGAMSGIGIWLPTTFSSYGIEIIELTNPSLITNIANQPEVYNITSDRIGSNGVNGQNVTFADSFKNLIDKTAVGFGLDGYYDGTSVVNNTAYKRTGKVPCKSGDIFRPYLQSPSVMALFDSTGVQRGTIQGTVMGDHGVFEIPSTIYGYIPAFCSISCQNVNLENVMLSKDTSVTPTSYIPYLEELAELTNPNLLTKLYTDNPKLTGKKWSYLGDSISARVGSYAEILGAKHKMTLRKHAADGAHMSKDITGYLIISEEYLNVDIDSDYITVAAGTNDSITNLGTMASRDITTFYGACHVTFAGLLARSTTAKVGVFNILPRSDMYNDSNKTKIKSDIIDEVAAYYSIPVLKLFQNAGNLSPIVTERKNIYMPDGLHPSSAGYAIYARLVENFLLSL